MNIILLLFGILIGIIIIFHMKVKYHGVNSNWFIKEFPDVRRVIIPCDEKSENVFI